MGLFQRIRESRDASRRATASRVVQEIGNRLYINPLCSDYENVFAQVQPLINDMSVVFPYGVGANGARLPASRTPEINLLKAPNDRMGWSEFANLMFATWLTEAELNIHVHRKSNGRVTGYSFVPVGARVANFNGEDYFQISTSEGMVTLTRDEVMTLRFSRSPRDIEHGISPAIAIRAWAQTEDVLAQYERAYIENGAIPASITFIRASSQERFNAVRDELEGNLRGARNKGKTIYVWRQFNNDTGDEKDQVEIKTIQGNNSTLAIRELTDIINDHLNKAFGVSNFILGDDSSAKYDNAELSDFQFIKRRVYPALVKFWNQFQFELDRITGGLGYAIQFDLTLPELTDREKVRAETKKTNVDSLISLIGAGSAPIAAVTALGLDKKWQKVAEGIAVRAQAVDEAQRQTTSNNFISLYNSSSQNEKNHTTQPNNNSISQARYSHVCASADKLPPMTTDEKKIYDILMSMAERIFKQSPNLEAEEVIDEINEILYKKARLGGVDGAERIAKLLKDEAIVSELTSALKTLEISGTLRERIGDRTTELVNNFGAESQRLFEEALENSRGHSAEEIREILESAMPAWQAERIARTETTYAFKSGRLDEDQRIADKYGLKMKLVWRTSHDDKVCDVCAAMDGETVEIGQAFDHLKETADGIVAWEPSAWNDDGKIPAPHPNCRCYFDEIVEEA